MANVASSRKQPTAPVLRALGVGTLARRRFGMLSLLRRPRALFRFLNDPNAPKLWQLIAVLSIAYVVLPIDAIPDVIPIIGWLDDLGIVSLALAFTASQAAKYEDKRLASQASAHA